MNRISSLALSRRSLLGGMAALPALSLFGPAAAQTATPAAGGGADWPTFRGGVTRTSYVSEPGPSGDLIPAWVFSVSAAINNPTVVGDAVYATTIDGVLYALDRATGAQRWAVNLGGHADDNAYPVPTVAGGVVYICSPWGTLFALDTAAGKERWRFATGDFTKTTAAVADGVVYQASVDGFLYALDAATGKQRWRFAIKPGIKATPAVADGRIYFGSDAGTFTAVDIATGKQVWAFETGGLIRTPALANGLVYVPSQDGALYALNPKTGTKRWSFASDKAVAVLSPAVSPDTVIVAWADDTTHGLDALTGKEIWSSPVVPGSSSPSIAGGLAYLYDNAVGLVALDLATGKQRGLAKIGGFSSTPTVAGGDLYVGIEEGKLYAFTGGKPTTVEVKSAPLTTAALAVRPGADAPNPATYVRTITGGPDGFDGPEGVAFDAQRRIWVVDSKRDRIQIFDANGTFIETWGESGSGNGQFRFHDEGSGAFWGDVAIGQDGSVYVVDPFNARVQKFDAGRQFLASWGIGANAVVKLVNPFAIAVDDVRDRVYVSDVGSSQLVAYDRTGAHLFTMAGGMVAGQLNGPGGIAIAQDGSFWVTDQSSSRLQHFDGSGKYIADAGGYGGARGRFDLPVDLVAAADGKLIATDYYNGRIQLLSADGSSLGLWSEGSGPDDPLVSPTYIAIGPDGLVYVSDETKNLVHVYKLSAS